MKIDLYTRCWNDAHMLGYFFRHYDSLVDRYIIFDDGSTDSSLEILSAHPKVDLRQTPEYSDPDSRIVSNCAVLEDGWQESRGTADWVIVTDIDEHLYHSNLYDYLAKQKSKGVTVILPLGFQMLSETFPDAAVNLSEALRMGAPSSQHCKMCLFAPAALEKTHFSVGRHRAQPTGDIQLPEEDEVFLLHYKYLNFERLYDRHQLCLSRQRKKDLEHGWGHKYAWDRAQLMKDWREISANLVNVHQSTLASWEQKGGQRWWLDFPRISN